MIEEPYRYSREDFARVLLLKFFPERTDRESFVMREYLARYLNDYDSVSFSVRVGQGATPIDGLAPAVAAQVIRNSRKRIDILAWKGSQPFIIEVKVSVTPATLGQILTYRHLLGEDFPDAPEPQLVVVGARSDPDTIRALQAHNITVYLYEDADTGGDVSPRSAGP